MNRLTMNRRDFLRRGIAGISVAGTFPLFLGKTSAAVAEKGHPEDDRILVVVQLSGGNDGLSTVVPYSDPAYGRARQTTRIGEGDVLKIDERFGLHPNLGRIKAIYDEGKMAIVHGVSYPNPTRSHFESMDVWHAGDRSGARHGSGWLGRAIDSTCGNKLNPLASVNLGGSVPLALVGRRSKPVAFQNAAAFQWRGSRDQEEAFRKLNSGSEKMEKPAAGPVSPLDYLVRVSADAQESSAAIRRAVQGYRPAAEYPANNPLAQDLRSIGAMIASGLPTRVFYAAIGGFDTHANQKITHDNLMTALSAAIGAFIDDLRAKKLSDRVLVLCFSEFGRRVQENGSRGTDHGVAAPMFLFGDRVRGGLHGEHPSFANLVQGDLAMTRDFREVYATVLDGWLGAPSREILGEEFEPLPIIGKRQRTF